MPAALSIVLALPKVLRVSIPVVDTVINVAVKVRNGLVYVLYNGNSEHKKLFVTKHDFNDPSKRV